MSDVAKKILDMKCEDYLDVARLNQELLAGVLRGDVPFEILNAVQKTSDQILRAVAAHQTQQDKHKTTEALNGGLGSLLSQLQEGASNLPSLPEPTYVYEDDGPEDMGGDFGNL